MSCPIDGTATVSTCPTISMRSAAQQRHSCYIFPAQVALEEEAGRMEELRALHRGAHAALHEKDKVGLPANGLK